MMHVMLTVILLLLVLVIHVATEEARKTTKCTIDIKYGESDAKLDIYYPTSGKCAIPTINTFSHFIHQLKLM